MLTILVTGCGGDSNSSGSSESDLTSNVYLVARVGPIVATRVNELAILDGSKSTNPSTAPLGYNWSFSSKPDSSNAVLLSPTTASPSFIADVRGAYMVQLVVSAEGSSSQRAIQLVVATIDPERSTGPFGHQGLSSTCVNCHSGELEIVSAPGKIPGKTSIHFATGNACEACHTPMGFTSVSPSVGSLVGPFTVSTVDHQEVFGNCSGCHDGVLAIGKSNTHIPTSVECDSCHDTTSFFVLELNGTFDHTGISSDCSVCHNGIVAIGETDTVAHQNTDSDCVFCHLPFSPPTVVDFTGGRPDHNDPIVLAVSCDSCHGNGVSASAQGEPIGHPVMAVDCGSCHGVVTFSLGGVFNHRIDPAVQTCESCHTEPNSFLALGKTSTPIHNGTNADCGNCHSTDAFTPAFAFDHTGIVISCQTCHGNNNPVPPQVTATGKPPSTVLYAHMPTVPNLPGTAGDQDCGDCHTLGTFTTGTYDHAGVVSGCESCHDNRISVGKLPNHFPTPGGSVCADCHYDIASTPTIFFAGATVINHALIATDCASCHNSTYTTTTNTLYGKASTHIPTSQDCSVCHASSVPFKPVSNFNHTNISNNCDSCHNGNSKFVAVGAIGKKINHIPALNECVVCHAATSTGLGGFASTTLFLGTIHNSITQGCEGCHTSVFFPTPTVPPLVKTVDHLPTSQDCDTCHIAAAFSPTITTPISHTGITGNCASCHDAGFATPKSQTHISTTQDCGACHTTLAPLSFTPAFVDHTGPDVVGRTCVSCHDGTITIGIIDDPTPPHVNTAQDCNICHVAGATFVPAVFNHTGIVDNCASCHNGTDAIGKADTPNPPHVTTTEDCSVCHNTTTFAGAKFNHTGITNSCASCHNGTTAPGKATSHVPTLEDCSVCHQTTGFLPATFDHTGIVDNCSSCHAAGFATPKTLLTHISTNQDCGVCHNTTAFTPATIDHNGPDVVGNMCDSCHNGTIATGKIDATPPHLNTGFDCSSCHTTATFVGGSWTHDSSATNNCISCHGAGNGATPKPMGHLTTGAQCDVCHGTNGWAPTNFSHSTGGNYPGDHRVNLGCSSCHKGTKDAGITIGNYPNQLRYAPACAGCHAGDFERNGDHIGGENGILERNKDCSNGGSGCHRVSDSGF